MDYNEIMQKIESLEKRINVLEKNQPTSQLNNNVINSSKKISSKEFLLTKTIDGDIQKTLALAYYLENLEGMESFNVPDLQDAFRSAKEKAPSNLNDMVNKNISKGYIMEAKNKKDSKKAWTLTSTGEKFVNEDLN